VGSTPHLGGELFRLTYKLDLVPRPFTGAAPAVRHHGGHTPIAFTALPYSLSAIQAGQVRAIAVAATERAEAIPDVPASPSRRERSGRLYADRHRGAAGTPKEIVRAAFSRDRRSVARPDVRERLAALGFKPVAIRLTSSLRASSWRWKSGARWVRDANLRIE